MRRYSLLALTWAALFMLISAQAEAAVTSTGADRRTLNIAVYNQNLAYVSEVRKVSLEQGQGELQLGDVPRYIQPDTVTMGSRSHAEQLQILEQNYLADVIDSGRLLDAFVGKKISIMQWNEYQDRHDTFEATLLSSQGNGIYEMDGRIYLGYPGTIVLPEVPANFVATPALRFLYQNSSAGDQDLDIAYLTGGLSWTANYQLILNEDMTAAELAAWVTLSNNSEAEFENANLRIIAGDLNQAPQMYKTAAPVMALSRAMADMAEAAPARGFQQSAAADYYQFELNQPVTLKNHEVKQIQLFSAEISHVKKIYRVQGGQPVYLTYRNPQEQKLPVQVIVQFENKSANGLGRPLPQGTVRFFNDNAKQQRTYLGEDFVAHTPEGEEIEWQVGSAFDLKAERIQTDYREVTRNVRETEFEIRLRNQKTEEAVFEVIENLSGDWTMLDSSVSYEKLNASEIRFRVVVPSGKETVIRYRVSTGR